MSSSDSDDGSYGNIIKKRDKFLKYFEAKYKEKAPSDDCIHELENKNDVTINSSVSKRGTTKRKGVDTNKTCKRSRKSGKLSKTESVTSISNDIEKNDVDAKIDAFIDLTDSLWPTNNINDISKSPRSNQNEPSNNDVILIDIEEESSTRTDSIDHKRDLNRRVKNTDEVIIVGSPRGRSVSRGRNATKSRGSSIGRGTPKDRGRGKDRVSQKRVSQSSSKSRAPVTRRQNKSRHSNIHVIPTFSIGNTDEYNDELENLQIFSSETKINSVSNKHNLTDEINRQNEELSVKVCWQSLHIHKFTIRRFQKLKIIYDFFIEKENVPINNLLFMYNDKILCPEDSPDSIDYNITKFIEGGVLNETRINNDKTNIVKKSGIEIKFQFQKSKKPYVIYIEKDESLSLAMIKCSEHLELPLNKLKFEFDGDTISGSETLRSLDMEGGECIDVKIIN